MSHITEQEAVAKGWEKFNNPAGDSNQQYCHGTCDRPDIKPDGSVILGRSDWDGNGIDIYFKVNAGKKELTFFLDKCIACPYWSAFSA